MPKQKFRITDVIEKDIDKMEPCLVQFSNGTLRKNADISGHLFQKVSKHSTKIRRTLKVDTKGGLLYAGQNYGPDVDDELKEKLFLGVVDEGSDEMKLVEMSSFVLHPQIEIESESKAEENANYLDQQKALSDKFGGKKLKKKVDVQMRKFVNLSMMSNAMNDALRGADVGEIEQTNDEELREMNYAALLPPCNRTAKTAKDVYKLSDIVTDEELTLFSEIADCCIQSGDESVLSDLFIALKIRAIQHTDDAVVQKNICAALFTEQLLKLVNKKPLDEATCPERSKKKILFYFFKNKLTEKQKVDRMMVHVIILCLLLNDLEFSSKLICRALSIDMQKLRNLVKLVGASWGKNKEMIVLKLPLTTLMISQKRKRV